MGCAKVHLFLETTDIMQTLLKLFCRYHSKVKSCYWRKKKRGRQCKISHLCILPALPPGWRVCPCWGPSAPSRSLWRFPWACGPAGRWGSPRSRSCHTTVPAAGCWTRTGCSTTGSAGRSSRSSRCSRRSPGRRAYLGVKRKTFFEKNITFLRCQLKSPPPQKKNSSAAANVPCQCSTLFHGASSSSIAHLISLLQPPFGFDFKWKMITQIAIAIFDLGKDKRSLSMASHYQVTDNAAPPTLPPSIGRCRNLPTAVIEATCGYQLGHEILSHVLGKRNARKPVSCTGDWTSYLTDNML